ncbi:hypothetical protein Mapa_016230 [Marchantia paleacea]|nr:hypothetical protein Mapa_016230 [Marchantia paleacea]
MHTYLKTSIRETQIVRWCVPDKDKHSIEVVSQGTLTSGFMHMVLCNNALEHANCLPGY